MSLADLIKTLENDLSRNLPRNFKFFAETRARRPELSPFETVEDVRCALDAASSLTTDARRKLVTALVEEAQTGTSPIWASLLVIAFAPMMHRLRSHAGPRRNEDLDSAVLVAFLSAVRAVRPGSYTSLALRWATEKEVLNACQIGPRSNITVRSELCRNPSVDEAAARQLLFAGRRGCPHEWRTHGRRRESAS